MLAYIPYMDPMGYDISPPFVAEIFWWATSEWFALVEQSHFLKHDQSKKTLQKGNWHLTQKDIVFQVVWLLSWKVYPWL